MFDIAVEQFVGGHVAFVIDIMNAFPDVIGSAALDAIRT